MTQEQIIALETVLDLAEWGAGNEPEEDYPNEYKQNWVAIDLIAVWLVKQRTLASLQTRINAL